MNPPLDPSVKVYFDALTDKVNDVSLSRFEWLYLTVMILQTTALAFYCIETWRLRKSAWQQTLLFKEQLTSVSEQNKTLKMQLELASSQLDFQKQVAAKREQAELREQTEREEERERQEKLRLQELEPHFTFEKGSNAAGNLVIFVREAKKTGTIEQMRTSLAGVSRNKIRDEPLLYNFSLIMPNNRGAIVYVGFSYKTAVGTISKKVFGIHTANSAVTEEPNQPFENLAYDVIT